jgi:small-conductance mechanosensitive channel
MKWLERSVYGNPVADWLIAFGIAAGAAMLLLLLLRRAVPSWLAAYARRTETRVDDAVAEILTATRPAFLLIVALYLGAQYLALPDKVARTVDGVALVALLLQAGAWGQRGIALALRRKKETDAAGTTTLVVLGFVGRIALWSVVLLMILDNLGVNITALVASLGIGGIAVALAVQNILGDIFASLSIALDRPFAIGDFIVVGDVLGTVEYIGLKTTRIRSLSGEQIVFSNADLLKSRIRNYKRMAERRVLFGFGVVYQTPAAKLERVPALVREIVESQPKTRFDRAHFKEYGDSSLNFEVVYHVLDPDYNAYMDIQQAINLAIFRRFQEEGIEFAYPTRTLYLGNVTPVPVRP